MSWLARHRWVAVVLTAVSLGLLVGSVAYAMAVGAAEEGSTWLSLGIGAAFGVVGASLAFRLPANPIGWFFTLGGFAWGVNALAVWPEHLYNIGDRRLPVLAALILTVSTGWPLLSVPSIQLPLLYLPSGRIETQRARWLVRTTVIAMVVVSAALIVHPGDIAGYHGVPNPVGLPVARGLVVGIMIAGIPFLLGSAVASVVGFIRHYRRAYGVERQQMRWVVLGGVFVLLAFVVGATTPSGLSGLGFAAIPVTVAVAVLRYRLYDLGRLVSRTVSYAILTALLAAVYLGTATAIGTVASGSAIGVATATLVTLALVRPLRSRLQTVVDRRFNRARYDAVATGEQFSARVRGQLTPESLRSELMTAVAGAVEPATISLWLAG